MPRTPRVLIVSESSFLDSGFGVYARETLSRLHALGRFELCELGCSGGPDDPRIAQVPWRFVANEPPPSDAAATASYASSPLFALGAFRFEQTCIEFRPDIVWTYRDWWYDEFVARSPFRKFFHWAHMATVDAVPQDEQWLDTYASADSILTYTDWGGSVLREQSSGRLNPLTASPGADYSVFRPVPDRAAHQRRMGLPEGAFVVGTCNRNQPRKLFPDLVEAFAGFLAAAPPELANRAFLYLHTTYPDAGWDLPRLIRDSGVGRRILLTYACRACKGCFPSPYRDARTACKLCGAHAAFLPRSAEGVSRGQLANVLNLMDGYVQYANSEGFGMSQVEAAACGVPVLSVDYSAMGDVVRKLGGRPIQVERLFWEHSTGCQRALPDNADLVEALIDLGTTPACLLARMGRETRAAAQANFCYDRTASVWAGVFDAAPLRAAGETWGRPVRTVAVGKTVPQGMGDAEWVRWHFTHALGRPDLADSYAAARMTRDLHWGQSTSSGSLNADYSPSVQAAGRPAVAFDRAKALEQFDSVREHWNHWEGVRCAS